MSCFHVGDSFVGVRGGLIVCVHNGDLDNTIDKIQQTTDNSLYWSISLHFIAGIIIPAIMQTSFPARYRLFNKIYLFG